NHLCSECNSNSDCSTGLTCSGGHCTCSTNANCNGTGICIGGSPNYCGCSIDAHCSNGGKCWGGRCTSPTDQCGDDGDCSGSGYTVGSPVQFSGFCQHQKHTVETKVNAGNMYFYNTRVSPHFNQPGLYYADVSRPATSSTESFCVTQV